MISIEYLRQFRIGGYAIFDFTISFIAIYLLSPLLTRIFRKIRLEVPKINWIYLTVPLSVVVHLIFGRMTPMTKNFLDLNGHYILKIVIIGLTVLGLRDVKIIGKKQAEKSKI